MNVWDAVREGKYENKITLDQMNEYSDRKAWREAWSKEERRVTEEFKRDAFAYFEITDHPKAEKAWSIAWDKGHANGFHEILIELDDLVELLK